MPRRAWAIVLLALVALAIAESCGKEPTGEPESSGRDALRLRLALIESESARACVADLRARFTVAPPDRLDVPALLGPRPRLAPQAVLGNGVASRFEAIDAGHVRPVIAGAARRASRTATVSLPRAANDAVRIEDDTSGVAVSFALRGGSDSTVELADGVAVYRGGYRGSDVVHRPYAEGTEDYVVFESKPEREEIAYDVDVSAVAGMRLVGDVLELLDARGVPRLRVTPPHVFEASGARTRAVLGVEGCAFDADPRPPWGRVVTPPRSQRCIVSIAWSAVTYPAMVDPAWTTTGSMATPHFQYTAALLLNGQVLVVGGEDGPGCCANLSSAELYDPSMGTFSTTGSMAAPRENHSETVLASGEVLVAGGIGASGHVSSAEVYDPAAGTFMPTAGSMMAPRVLPSATLLGSNLVLIAGGYDAASESTAELYDPTARTFSPTGSMKVARVQHTATMLGSGKVLIAGGSNTVVVSSAELYDPSLGSFADTTTPMNAARAGHAATVLGSGRVLLTAGSDTSGPASTAEIYDPTAGTFAFTGSLATARAYHTATLLGVGKVLVAGGSGSSALSSAELFDPTAGGFVPTGSMPVARYNHTATLLGSGAVLVAGGYNGSFLSEAELFDLVPSGGACAVPGECLSGVCIGGLCGQIAAGAACAASEQCLSGVCNEGICCASACPNANVCYSCALGTGACASVTNADDPDNCNGAMTCNAGGACELKTSQPCPGGASTCATGFCSDGVCCDAACANECDVCSAALGASADGTCAPAPVGSPGSPACGGGAACNGKVATCVTPCVDDSDCLPTDYCTASGTCAAQRAQGAACNTAAGADCKAAGCRACASLFCVDGVCCDTPCNTLCQACSASLKQSGATDGVCGNAKAQSNPHGDSCPTSPRATCGVDGECSGTGTCSLYWPAGTACSTSTVCIAGNAAAGDICDGAGTCAQAPTGQPCGNYLCANGCPTTCASDGDCISTAYCAGQSCVPRGTNGAPCTSVDQCASGICVDGVCCNTLCDNQCESCNGAGTAGTCTPVVGSPVGARAPCAAGDAQHPCTTAQCDGITATACRGFVGASTACGVASCASGTATLAGACDGKGSCVVPPTQPCGAYACAGTACKTTCTIDGDCAQGSKCDTSGKCISGSTCAADGVTLVSPTGQTTPCAPYKCAGSACLQKCASVDDCVSPAVCDPSGACLASGTNGADGKSGACACTTAGASPPARTGALTLLAIPALATRRRRRRRATASTAPTSGP